MSRRIQDGWQAAVAEYRRSGATHRAFAARYGISITTLRRWLDRADAVGRDRPSLLPVRVIASTAPAARGHGGDAGSVELLLPGGIHLAVPAGTDVRYVASLVGALASSPC